MPVFLAQGPMNDGTGLYNAVQAIITTLNAAGGNTHFLDVRGAQTDGEALRVWQLACPV